MIAAGIGGAVGLATLLSRPIFRLVEGTRAIAEGNFDVALAVTSRDEIGALTESFNQMARSLREKEMIKRAFTRYVAREVVEEILKDPEHLVLTGERREVTVLFCDVRGFTPMSERLSPEEVVLLNDFYTLMIETTFKHDGTLDKFLGDAVMAIFGAPLPHPDHSVRAVLTALAMQEGIGGLNEKRARQGKEGVTIGIGVSAGEAVAGTVGTEDRMEYTVIGDSVNLAARLESNAKPGQILISHRTWEKVHHVVDARALGAIKVKGKEEEVEVYEVLGVTGSGGRAMRGQREAEMARIRARLDRGLRGTARGGVRVGAAGARARRRPRTGPHRAAGAAGVAGSGAVAPRGLRVGRLHRDLRQAR